MMRLIIISLVIGLTLSSCSVEPEDIRYGEDACHFCKMNIVDKQHAAQYVTKKGKQYKFDAIECMINDIAQEGNEPNLAFLLVSNYGTNGEMIDANNASYLISKGIKSPMGAFLSAFKMKEKAVKTAEEMGGDVYSWKEVRGVIEKL